MGCLLFQIFLFHFQILFWPGPWIQSLWECSSNLCCQPSIYSPHLFSCQIFSHGGGVVGLTLLFLYLYLCKSLVHPAIPSCFLRLGSFYIIAVILVSMTGTTIPRHVHLPPGVEMSLALCLPVKEFFFLEFSASDLPITFLLAP